jgi:phenylacetate-CoA ligase
MDKCFMAGLAYFEGLRRIRAATIRVGSGPVAMLLSLLERLQPTAVVSVPSFLKKVAGYAAEKGFDLAGSSVSKLIFIGEPVRTADFQLNSLGEYIAKAWGASLYSTYGVTEMATSLCECEAGRGGHLHPDLLYLEIIDEEGRGVEDGQVGEIVATTFGVEAMPLLRFRTGDCSFLVRERCTCGRWTPRIGPILGRKNQAMKLKGTTVYPAAVQRILDATEEVSDYVLIVTCEAPLSDQLEVVVALKGPVAAEEAARRKLQEKLQGELKVTPSVRIASAAEVEHLQNLDSFRKKHIFIDRRPGLSP